MNQIDFEEFVESMPEEFVKALVNLNMIQNDLIGLEYLLDEVYDHFFTLAVKGNTKALSVSQKVVEKARQVYKDVFYNENIMYFLIKYVDDLEDAVAFSKGDEKEIENTQ